jgi:hypothetical protein
MKIGDKVYVDADTQEWGRVCSDGEILNVLGNLYLVECVTIKAAILVKAVDFIAY